VKIVFCINKKQKKADKKHSNTIAQVFAVGYCSFSVIHSYPQPVKKPTCKWFCDDECQKNACFMQVLWCTSITDKEIILLGLPE